MQESIPSITTLHDLLTYDTCRFMSAENQLVNSLPEWINKAGSLQLKTILQKYHDLVQQHIQSIDAVAEAEKISAVRLTNRVMRSFIEEANEKLANCSDPEVRDACLLASIQAINHFKISAYGTAAAFANALNMDQQAAIFHELEVKEKQIDDRLSQLAEHEINIKARAPIVLPG